MPKVHVPHLNPDDYKEAVEEFNKNGRKILIVGAGATGLYAAYTLQYLGVEDYEILEAHNEIGGRMRQNTEFLADFPFDEGAEWIHTDPCILQDLILFPDVVNVETFPYKPQTWSTYANGKRRQRNWLRFLYGETKFKNTTWFSYFRDYINNHIPKDRIHRNTVVDTIDYSRNDTVTITTKDGRTFTGSNVMVTVSVGILQRGDISFVPPMPKKVVEEWNKVTFAPGFKLWIEFREKFYPDYQAIGNLADSMDQTDDKIYFDAVLDKPTERHVMGSLQLGPSIKDRAEMSNEELVQDVLKELDQVFDGKASSHYIKSTVRNWSAEPFVGGTYSTSFTHDKKTIIAGAGNRRVVFAGEYLADPQITVHGSALLGRYVAEWLLKEEAPNRQPWWKKMF